MAEYKLTFTVTISAMDDPAAKEVAREIQASVSSILNGSETKLQRVYPDKPPRGIQID